MSEVFLKILNMSFVASWLILAVILLRLALKKAPKWITCALWALVAIRLVCPFSPKSPLSVIRNQAPITQAIVETVVPEVSFKTLRDREQNNLEEATKAPEDVQVHVSHALNGTGVAAGIWALGVVSLLSGAGVSFGKLHRRVRPSLHLQDNIWLCDEIATPFLLGVLRPKIYIPSGVEEQHLPHIIAHENAHMKRRDHWWKLLGFLVLAIHWFNPLVWVAYTLLGRDIELACDEKVVRDLDKRESVAYSEALLSCSLGRRTILVCPLAFGEVGVKERVEKVLNYKKPPLRILLAASVAFMILAIGFLTDPSEAVSNNESTVTINTESDEVSGDGKRQNVVIKSEKVLRGDSKLIEARGGTLLPDDELSSYVWIKETNGITVYYKLFRSRGNDNVYMQEYEVGNLEALNPSQRELAEQLPNGVFPVNKKGESYGSDALSQYVGYEPDLVEAQGENDKGDLVDGYIRMDHPNFKTPQEALEWQNQRPSSYDVPLYDCEGMQIGVFHMGGN